MHQRVWCIHTVGRLWHWRWSHFFHTPTNPMVIGSMGYIFYLHLMMIFDYGWRWGVILRITLKNQVVVSHIFLFSSRIPGEMIQFDFRIFSTTNQKSSKKAHLLLGDSVNIFFFQREVTHVRHPLGSKELAKCCHRFFWGRLGLEGNKKMSYTPEVQQQKPLRNGGWKTFAFPSGFR